MSARKSAKNIKEYVEWLYALLHCSPRTHLDIAKYRSPINPYEAEYDKTNTGIPVNVLLRCGDNPYLVARLAKDVSLMDASEEEFVLKWTNPDRLLCDTKMPHRILTKIPGRKVQAPIHLPLRITHFATDENQEIALRAAMYKEPIKSVAMKRKAGDMSSPGGLPMTLEKMVLASMTPKKT